MKERPILFSAPMVRALLDGSKTQTRRIIKADPGPYWNPVVGLYNPTVITNGGYEAPGPEIFGASDETMGRKSPCGQPGDRLWVRETWGVISNAWDEDGNLVDWVPDRPATEIHEMPFGQGYYSGHVIYAADGGYEWAGDDDGGGEPRSAWHPSIHMPRAASRILLEIVSVRVERLNDISEADARAEGAKHYEPANHLSHGGWSHDEWQVHETAKASFEKLWERINGAGSWEANPWCWVVEFKRVAPMTRILVIGANHGLTAGALVQLGRAAGRAGALLRVTAVQIQPTARELQLEPHTPLDLKSLLQHRPAPKFGGDRPYLKRKKGRS